MFKDWTEKRVRKIISIFGKDWFHHKKILELGACHGDVGLEFLKLGADVLFTDARESNLKILHDKWTNELEGYVLHADEGNE